ncbi:MAG TPA: hypothetical protein VFQ45_07850 [Longimicrobium sp.]|nr:hypothetical protein [Longimicrobium sp.]
MRSRSILSFLVPLLLAAAPVAAQRPVEPYDPSGRYRTFLLGAQFTGAFEDGRELVGAWGVMRAGGRSGAWMQRTDMAAGLRSGFSFVDRIVAGPQVSLARAFPSQHTSLMGGRSRAEPYLLLGGGALGVLDTRGRTRAGLAPSVSAGAGFRMLRDEWDITLQHFEVVIEKRFGMLDEAPQLYVRFGTALPRRRGTSPRPAEPPPGRVRG